MAKIDKICPVVNLLTSQIWNKILFEYVSILFSVKMRLTVYFPNLDIECILCGIALLLPSYVNIEMRFFFYCTSIAKYFAMVIKTIILHRVLYIFIYAND